MYYAGCGHGVGLQHEGEMKSALRRNSEQFNGDVLWVPWIIMTFNMTVEDCLDLPSDISMQGDVDKIVDDLMSYLCSM